MHSLVQPYEDPIEENRHVLEKIGNVETPHPHPGTSVRKKKLKFICNSMHPIYTNEADLCFSVVILSRIQIFGTGFNYQLNEIKLVNINIYKHI